MKKIALLSIIFVTLLSCSRVDNGNKNGGLNLQFTISDESRVEFVDNKYTWGGGEQIGLYLGATALNNHCCDVAVRDGVGYASVAASDYQATDMLYAYMPYNSESGDIHNVKIEIPATQTILGAGDFPQDAMPMVASPRAVGDSGEVALKLYPLGTILCFNVYTSGAYDTESVLSVRYATSKPVAGNTSYDLTATDFALSGVDSYSVTTNLEAPYSVTKSLATTTPIYVVVAPGNLSGTLSVTTDTAIYSYNYTLTAERNKYYDINIDLSKAQYRKVLGSTTSATATLTYDECKSSINGYNSPKSYKNSYGTWTICAYNYNNEAIQLNKGKVAYVGTPTFANPATSITLTLAESYSGSLYICTEAGSTNASGIAKTVPVNGASVTANIGDLNLKSFYIRSGACMRISKIDIKYGEDNGSVLPDPTPEPDPEPTPDPTPDPDPTPPPDPTPTPTEGKYNWAELPVINDADGNGVHDTDSNIYYAHHICAGGEKNAQRTGTARNYTVCFSGKHHCPLWVAAPRHKSYESGASRTDAYAVDPKIPSNIQYNSKSTGGGCNKGHMLGSAERLSTSATNKQVFYYTNIAPQYSSTFNTGGGAWNNLEDHIDGLVCSDTLYVVIGCYFEKFSKNGASASPKTIEFGGRTDVSCPTMFYYALLRTKKGNLGKSVHDCSASELQCAAFTICHEMGKGHKPEAADMMSISELEKLTGFSYFQNVPQAPKDSYSSSDWL